MLQYKTISLKKMLKHLYTDFAPHIENWDVWSMDVSAVDGGGCRIYVTLTNKRWEHKTYAAQYDKTGKLEWFGAIQE